MLTHAMPLLRTLVILVAFTLASASTYLLNDTFDAEADRRHPRKRHRPVAAGIVPVWLAVAAGIATALSAVVLAGVVLGRDSLVLIVCYLALTACYTAFLKHEPIVELVVVAAGFVLRAVAGGIAAPVPLSELFLTVACFASIVMVTGKRIAEQETLGTDGAGHRAVLDLYPEGFLRLVLGVSVAVTIAAYCLWAFEKAAAAPHDTLFFDASIAPFIAAVLRYALLIWSGHGGAPEELVLSDRRLQLIGAVWLIVFSFGIYRI